MYIHTYINSCNHKLGLFGQITITFCSLPLEHEFCVKKDLGLIAIFMPK